MGGGGGWMGVMNTFAGYVWLLLFANKRVYGSNYAKA